MLVITKRFRKEQFLSFFKTITNRNYSNTVNILNVSNRKSVVKIIPEGPSFKDFLQNENKLTPSINVVNLENVPYLKSQDFHGNNRKVHFEVYGCQMNENDTELVWAILNDNGFIKVDNVKDADVILLITCAIREGAETKIWNRLKHLSAMKKNRSNKKEPLQIGILGCMAERLKTNLIEKEKYVDIVAGPDSYKDLPRLLAITKNTGQSAVNVLLSLDETYADIMPVRLNSDSPTAFVSIMRGCDNMCSYCIVPFTRGKERSRPIQSIINEVNVLKESGIKEITLLGQNVNSYRDLSTDFTKTIPTKLASGFKTVYKEKKGGTRFADLLECIACTVPDIRIRFTSPHPKDFPDDVLHVIKSFPNISKNIHLPAQSGNSFVLERMRRGYTIEAYYELVNHIRNIIPDVSLSSDFICGFCGETDEEFQDTLTLINTIKYNTAYLFAYSMREKTTAHRRYIDNVPADIKNERLQKMVNAFRVAASEVQSKFIGKKQLILIEGFSKKSKNDLVGRNDANIKVIIPVTTIPTTLNDFKERNSFNTNNIQIGDFVAVQIHSSNSQVLKGTPLYKTTISEFYQNV